MLSSIVRLILLVGTASSLAAVSATVSESWLDRPLSNWNKGAGALRQLPVPVPSQRDATAASRCREQGREPVSAAEKALVRRGWTLYGAPQSFGRTKVISALSGFDGTCRPLGFQAFVYWKGRYAGTLSPLPMSSGTDAALTAVRLESETAIAADFTRSASSDPACPSRPTSVFYNLKRYNNPALTPTRATTAPPCRSQMDKLTSTAGGEETTSLSGRWVLTEMGEQRLSADKPYVEFDRAAMQIAGDGGCNRFSGAYENRGSSLTISRLAATKRACVDAEANRVEREFLRSMGGVQRFDIREGTLRLYVSDGGTLAFIRR
ncbi:MAG: META domain-containing protein [Thermoanaerobaculia bacterium]|nr:META domain-containing protein [Thermoanaerobaculia bacterium]